MTTTCLDVTRADAYVQRTLSPAEALAMDAHLPTCPACQALAAEAAANLRLADRLRKAFPTVADDAGPEARIGSFRILSELGRGGMGVVYLALQARPERKVALKVMLPGMATDDVMRRFRQEVELLGRLDHPGIARIYEAGVHEDPDGGRPRPYFAMEYIEGATLERHLAEKQLSIVERLDLLAQICDAVHHAHVRGIVHRDLKPGNILISHSTEGEMPEVPRPKILDFGVARSLDSDVRAVTMETELGRVLGTVPLMSPEQIRGDSSQVDARTDVYALGVTGYWMLTGAWPYRLAERTLPEAARIIQDQTPTPASSHDERLKGDVETILARALEKEPDRRYQSASELAADVRRFLKHEPIVARPSGAFYHFSRFARRNRALTSLVAALFVVTAFGAIAAATLALRSNRAEHSARFQQAKAEKEAARASAMNDFLLRVLSSADPYAAWGGREVTVAEALDMAAAQLDSGQLAGQPETEISVRHTVGNAFRTLGNYALAESLFTRACAVSDSFYGPGDIHGLSIKNDLAAVYAEQGQFDRAVDLARTNLEIARSHGTPEDEVKCMANLGPFLAEQGRFGDAADILTATLARLKALYGPEHAEVAIALHNLGALRFRSGEYEQAQRASQAALTLQAKIHGTRHPLTVLAAHRVGRAALALGDLEDAAHYLQIALDTGRVVFGPDHPEMAAILNSHGELALQAGDLDSAANLLSRALEQNRRLSGTDHPSTARSLVDLGRVRREQRKFQEADSLMRDAESIYRRTQGDGHPFVAMVLHERAITAARRGRTESARALWEETVRIRTEQLGADNPLTRASRDSLARLNR